MRKRDITFTHTINGAGMHECTIAGPHGTALGIADNPYDALGWAARSYKRLYLEQPHA